MPQYQAAIYQYLEYAFGYNGHGQPAWRTAAPYNRSFFNKSAEVLDEVKAGRVKPKRDIARCHGKLVQFTDGSSAIPDSIVMCSGYRATFPFFDGSIAPGTDPRRWFKHIFFDRDPSLAFVGFARPIFGSIPGLAEIQSRYVAKVFSGVCRLPDRAMRIATIDRDTKFWHHHFRFTSQRLTGLVDHYVYCNQLARLIGCYPNFRGLLLSSPRRWWQAVIAPWNGCQFWLNDPKHHERIFATFRRYDENRISQNYVFLALAPVLPLIGLLTHLRVIVQEWFSRAEPAVPAPPVAAQASRAAGFWPSSELCPPGLAAAATAGGSFCNSAASEVVAGGAVGAVAGRGREDMPGDASMPWPAPSSNAPAADDAASSVQVVARIVEMLSGGRSRLEAADYIDPHITIHMDAAVQIKGEYWCVGDNNRRSRDVVWSTILRRALGNGRHRSTNRGTNHWPLGMHQ